MDASARRSKLQRFDTRPFTLHAHCGHLTEQVRACLLEHGVANDPVTLEETGWAGAKPCRAAWEAYRTCGRLFLQSTEKAHLECASEAAAYSKCAARSGAESEACVALEHAAMRCASARIKARMSGGALKDAGL